MNKFDLFSLSSDTYVQKCMQWRKWRTIASLWRFELDAKRGPLETGDFGEIGGFGKNRQRAGDNGDKRPDPLETGNFAKMAILAKLAILAKITRGSAISRMWQIFKLDAKSGPFKLDN